MSHNSAIIALRGRWNRMLSLVQSNRGSVKGILTASAVECPGQSHEGSLGQIKLQDYTILVCYSTFFRCSAFFWTGRPFVVRAEFLVSVLAD